MGNWSDIIIGKGITGTTAYHVFKIKGDHNISENKNCFWISESFLGMGLTIFKDTKEGIALVKMIDDEEPLSIIKDFIDSIVLKNARLTQVKNAIKNIRIKAHYDGVVEKQKEIQVALGL